ncbi:hypothetical protein [Lactiplantibacillus plantarum]|uniref:hypothetical protein n=1 Tax=Lactiplantibacillus plantarum TaxID=1590 RepID=UPI002238B237|nr:hypothetical protein [Lactiplantibacillus plantarum]MCW6144389.1 hypothetical protein [Lactiplantibacillus plantarum]
MAEYLDADLAVLTPYLEKLGATPHRAQLITLLNWVHTTFPQHIYHWVQYRQGSSEHCT